MIRRRLVGVLLASILIGCFGGCGANTSFERTQRARIALEFVEDKARTLQEMVGQFEQALGSAQTMLADPNLPAELREKWTREVVRLQGQIDDYAPAASALGQTVRELQDLVVSAQTAAGEAMDIGQEIQLYGRSLIEGSRAMPQPLSAYAALIGLILTLIGGSLGALTQRKKDTAEMQRQAELATDTLHGVVSSVNALLASDAVVSAPAAKEVLQQYQVEHCPEARAAVRQVQGLIA